MSEEMAIESLAVEWLAARLNTQTKRTRFKLYGANRGYSDIDAIASSSNKGILAMAECKVQGPATAVFPYSPENSILDDESYCSSMLQKARTLFLSKNKWVSESFQMGPTKSAWNKLRILELWLIANIFIPANQQKQVDNKLTEEITSTGIKGLPQNVEIKVFMRSTIQIILDMYRIVEKWILVNRWGPRFGHAQLDLLREIARYKSARAKPCRDYYRKEMKKILIGNT